MPTKRFCCGDCYTYFDDFERTGDDVTLLEPDWQVCDDWSDWYITASGLHNTVDGATVVLKHMVGNPTGILRTHITLSEDGQKYRVHIFKGTQADPCSASFGYCEIELRNYLDQWYIYNRIVIGGSTVEEEELLVAQLQNAEWTVCVGDEHIESILDSINASRVRNCTQAEKYWFALESIGNTRWGSAEYIDHYDHDRRCPHCYDVCFVDKAIVALTITITGIADYDCTNCPSSYTLEVRLPEGYSPCDDNHDQEFVEQVEAGDCPTIGPGGILSPYTVRAGWQFDCRDPSNVILIVSWGGTAPGEQAYLEINLGPRPVRCENIVISNQAPTFVETPSGTEPCDWTNTRVSATVHCAEGCCYDPLDPLSTEEVSVKLRVRRSAVTELPYADHAALIDTLRTHAQPQHAGLGDTAKALLADEHCAHLHTDIRRWLRFYSCSRSQACAMVNRHFQLGDQNSVPILRSAKPPRPAP